MSYPRSCPSRFKARFAVCEIRPRHLVGDVCDAGQVGKLQMLALHKAFVRGSAKKKEEK